jgi:Holliday junction resolvasome RuvABC endonuclease subunit
MNILAIDPGTRTGWAIKEETADPDFPNIESGVQVFDLKRGESPGMRFVRFTRWLEEFDAGGRPHRLDLVVYEQAHHRGGAATEVGVGLSTRVLEFAARHGIEHASIHSATLKKWVTGSGRAGKPEMIQWVLQRWGHPVRDDNEADALALLHYAMEEMG